MSQDYSVGQRLGDYEVLGVLGAGGMGKVYKVRNVISDRVEAIKILLPNLANQKDLADRFQREIKLLASLNHPNIAALRTAMTVDDQLVMVMEYVEGVTLASLLHQGPVAIPSAVNYVDQVLDALTYAHHMNVIHRDIKPANMMLTPQGVVKLMDFGVARPGNEAGMTLTGTTLGSLNYMPPEQVKGEAVDSRSDLYSVGVSLYEIVTARLPFRGDSNYALMTAQLQEAPPPPISARPDLPKTLNDIILMAMAKEPEKRFQSALAFRNALKNVSVDADATLVPVPAPAVPPTTARPATSAAQPVAAAAAATGQMPPPAAQKSSRGLYVALGAILVVAMLAGAAVYVPRRMKTNAGAGSASNSTTTTSTAPASAPDATPDATSAAATPAAPAEQPAAAPSSAPAPASAASSARAAAQAAASQAAAQADADAKAKADADAAAQAAALAEAEKQGDQLSSRAAAVSQSLDNLKRQQAAQGYGLRGDMAAAEQRMQIDLARAEAALQKQDAAGAKEYMDRAETEIETLERFLGH